MRLAGCTVGMVAFAYSIGGFAQVKIPCSQTLSRSLQARTDLVIKSDPAGIQIVGADRAAIHVSCSAGSEEAARGISFHLSSTANDNELSIEGAGLRRGDNGVEITIEVPRRTNLSVRMFAGQVKVKQVKGDKDIELGAGQIIISSIYNGDYRSVDASVGVGEVQARAFGADKGGFFRSFTKKDATGDYRLRAHVATGQIEMLGNADEKKEGAKSD